MYKSIHVLYCCFFMGIAFYCNGQTKAQQKKDYEDYRPPAYPFNWKYLLQTQEASNRDSLLPTYTGNGFQYINLRTGKPVSDMVYQEAYPFIYRCGLVKFKNKYGVVDDDGQWWAKPVYDSVQINKWHFTLFTQGKIECLNLTDHTLGDEFSCIEDPGMVESPQLPEKSWPEIFKDSTGRFGIRMSGHPPGKIITPAIYDALTDIKGNLSNIRLACKDGKTGVINYHSNQELVPFEYDNKLEKEIMDNCTYLVLSKQHRYYYFTYLKYYGADYNQKVNLLCNTKQLCFLYRDDYYTTVIGMYQNNQLYNLIFRDGSTLPADYKWIDFFNGHSKLTTAINTSDELVFVNPAGKEFVFYKKKKQ